MTWIRASLARIRRGADEAAWLEALADESLSGIRPRWFCVDTRRRRRVSRSIGRLAGGFAIAFARNHSGVGRGGVLPSAVFRAAYGDERASGPRAVPRGFAVY